MKHKTKINNNISQYEVDCPRSIQRKMRSNLVVASRTKVNKARAMIAKSILESTRDKPLEQTLAVAVKSDSSPIKAEIVKAVQPDNKTAHQKFWNKAKTRLRILTRNISNFFPAKQSPRLTNH